MSPPCTPPFAGPIGDKLRAFKIPFGLMAQLEQRPGASCRRELRRRGTGRTSRPRPRWPGRRTPIWQADVDSSSTLRCAWPQATRDPASGTPPASPLGPCTGCTDRSPRAPAVPLLPPAQGEQEEAPSVHSPRSEAGPGRVPPLPEAVEQGVEVQVEVQAVARRGAPRRKT